MYIDIISMILTTLFLGLFFWCIIREMDAYEKEPVHQVLLASLFGAASGVAFGVFSLGYLQIDNPLFHVALAEPIKFMAFLLCYPLIQKEMNEPVDGMIYMGSLALGFAVAYQLVYALYADLESLSFMKAFWSIPMHIAFSMFMGLAYYLHQESRDVEYSLVAISICMAIGLHTFYEMLLYIFLYNLPETNWRDLTYLLPMSGAFLGFIFTWNGRFLRYAEACSPFRIELKDFIQASKISKGQEAPRCPNCGDDQNKEILKNKNLFFYRCTACDWYMLPRGDFSGLLYPTVSYVDSDQLLKDLDHQEAEQVKESHMRRSGGMGKSGREPDGLKADSGMIAFDLDRFHQTLEKSRQQVIENLEAKWYFPEIHSKTDLERRLDHL